MLNKMATRRDVLKTSAIIAGATLVPTALVNWSSANSISSLNLVDPQVRGQVVFIKAVLQKHSRGSVVVNRKHVNEFATRFTEQYGVVDYKRFYSGPHGEYKLTRLFARSIFQAPAAMTSLGA